jgi:hypothetical protein
MNVDVIYFSRINIMFSSFIYTFFFSLFFFCTAIIIINGLFYIYFFNLLFYWAFWVLLIAKKSIRDVRRICKKPEIIKI